MNDEMVYVTGAEIKGYLQKIKYNRNLCIVMMIALLLVIAVCAIQGGYLACIPAVCGFCFLGYRLFVYAGMINKIVAITYSRSLTHAIKLVPRGHIHDKKVLCNGAGLSELKNECYSEQIECITCPKCLALLACHICGAKVGEKCDAGLHS